MNVLRLIPIAAMLAIFCLPSVQAQTQKHAKNEKTMVTGCLMKGDQANEYKITENGTTYELYSAGNVNMAEHVGHKVTVTGKMTSSQESAASTDSGTARQRLDVTNLKHISDTCR